MLRFPLLLIPLLLAGCQSTHDYLLSQGYPAAFADGFADGCGSGRQAAGAITGSFSKDVPRYLRDPQYAEGWSDGFRQCQTMAESAERRDYENRRGDERDEAWQREKDRAMGKVLRAR